DALHRPRLKPKQRSTRVESSPTMPSRLPPALVWFGGSAVVLAGLVAALAWPNLFPEHSQAAAPLIMHCAASQRAPVSEIAAAYEAETGQSIELRFGPSEALLNGIKTSGQGDIFLPADESYLDDARQSDLVAEVVPIARMNAVLAVPAGNPKKIGSWGDLTSGQFRLAQAYPAAAIGRLTHEHLAKSGKWEALRGKKSVDLGAVTEVANAVALG